MKWSNYQPTMTDNIYEDASQPEVINRLNVQQVINVVEEEEDEPFFGTNIREAVAIIKDWVRSLRS